MLVQPIEKFSLGLVGREVSDERRLCRVSAQFFQARSIIFHYTGGGNPGERNHSSIEAAASACCALNRTASRSGPGGSNRACSRHRDASATRRSFKVVDCLKRRRCCTARILSIRGKRDRNR